MQIKIHRNSISDQPNGYGQDKQANKPKEKPSEVRNE